MMDYDEIILIVIHDNTEFVLQMRKSSTVGELKEQIQRKFSIPPTNQLIDCWYRTPNSDGDILETCCISSEINHLIISDKEKINETLNMDIEDNEDGASSFNNDNEHEGCAALDFVQYFMGNYSEQPVFHICRLEDAINEACLTTLDKRKVLILYFHNKNDPLAKIFGENLMKPNVKELLLDRFFLLGWDVENEEYHKALISALNQYNELSPLVNFIEKKTCAALLIVPINDSITLCSCIRGKISEGDFINTLKKAREFLIVENNIEGDLAAAIPSQNDIGSVEYQQLMLDLLGDRDYDSFDFWEKDLLQEKIGYALFGPPQKETGYDDKQTKKIDAMYNVIIKENNFFAKWKDRVIISFIFNCTEPLPSEKSKRSKKYKDYNPNTDLNPVPIFVLRKCKNSPNACRIFIDDSGRVYSTWAQYLDKNKLPKCEMTLPLNGKYEVDSNGRVKLEKHLSPACGIDAKILFGADVTSSAAGVIAGGVIIAAAIPAITVAPVALIVAGATGLGAGVYSMGRSIYTLYDRNKHKETLSFANSESRGAYLNIVAGSLGFAGAGANLAMSQLVSRGIDLGKGSTAALNVLNVANIGVSGVNVANSSFDVLHQWLAENQTPSLLTMVQLSSSILFFGHAIYNFKSAGTIIEESQVKTLQDYQESLRSNRHRKTFDKLTKETIRQHGGDATRGQAEVIKTIRQIQNKDEVFASLTRANKDMNKVGVRFSAEGGQIKLNGVPVNMAEFNALNKNEVASFITQLPSVPEPSQADIKVMNSKLQNSIPGITATEVVQLSLDLFKIFSNDDTIKDKIINSVIYIVKRLIGDLPDLYRTLDLIFPQHRKYMRLVDMVTHYFQKIINEIDERYQRWLNTKDPNIEEPYFFTLALDYGERMAQIFTIISKVYFIGTIPTELALKEIMNYFHAWFTKQVLEYEEFEERKNRRNNHCQSASARNYCTTCGGEFYH